MSIIRTVREMGLSLDDFLITGNERPRRVVTNYADEIRGQKKILEMTHTLDTAAGWLERGRLLKNGSKPAGFINDKVFFNIDQTVAPSEYKKEMLNVVDDTFDKLIDRMIVSGIKSELDFDEKAHALYDSLAHVLKQKHKEFKAKVSFDTETHYQPMSAGYIRMDEDVPL